MNFNMNFLLTLGIMLCWISNMIAADYPEMQLVLRGGESVKATNNPREYFGGWCEIGFPENGALYAEIPGSEGIWHIDFAPNPNSLCVNSTETVRYKLNRDGNFVIKCGFPDYITHSNQGQTIDTFMTIDDRCRLYIFEGTFGCDSVSVDKELWRSDIYEPLGPDDRLYKGQVFRGMPEYYMMLDPRDGNLEVRNEMSHGTYDVVWQSSDEWVAPPGPEMHDYYAKITKQGFLKLVGIDYSGPSLTESVYFSKDLGANGASCFTLGWELKPPVNNFVGDPIDLIAVPCGNDDRRLQSLRGSTI